MGVNASYCVKETAAGALDEKIVVLSSKQLMADQHYTHNNESIDWYKENTIYSDDYKKLLEIISNNEFLKTNQ